MDRLCAWARDNPLVANADPVTFYARLERAQVDERRLWSSLVSEIGYDLADAAYNVGVDEDAWNGDINLGSV